MYDKKFINKKFLKISPWIKKNILTFLDQPSDQADKTDWVRSAGGNRVCK